MEGQRPAGRRRNLSEEEREKCEQQIQKEEERMREEREQNLVFKLTEEQKRIRRNISQRAYRLRAKTKKKAKDKIDKQESVAQMQSGEETETITQGRQKQVLSEEEQRLRAEQKQAEEMLIREQREQHIFPSKTTIDQLWKDWKKTWARGHRHQLRMEREATDEEYQRWRMAQEEEQRSRAEREQAEEKLMRDQREQHIPRARTLTDQQRKDRDRIRARNYKRRIAMERKATDEKDPQKRMTQIKEERFQLRVEREQAEEKLMREEQEQHIPPQAKTLTDQQRKDRKRIWARHRNRRIAMERKATKEKDPQKGIMAQRNSAGEETINAEIDNPVVEAPPTVDHPMS
ncbi:hypothetical protein MMC22_010061 [Lobaria immixta]|nr:hypothetical protein [Lobaria immixta]